LLAQQKSAQAAETLERFSQHFDQPGDMQTALEWMGLYAVALHQSGKKTQALRVAARLLRQTEPEGIIRVYLDAGDPMKQALLTWLSAARPAADEAPQDDDSCATAVSISRSYLSRLLATFEQEKTHSPTSTEAPWQGAEPLSRQEQRVLRLLVAGQTYAEIAEALIVSPNTVKTQVSSIYRKLGVSRRAEAIAKTSRLHLLSSK
jgi:LuxR family transcriptional regulator, maltose regulon positive regulatory protein